MKGINDKSKILGLTTRWFQVVRVFNHFNIQLNIMKCMQHDPGAILHNLHPLLYSIYTSDNTVDLQFNPSYFDKSLQLFQSHILPLWLPLLHHQQFSAISGNVVLWAI